MEILTRFGIEPKLLLAQIVNFTIILFVLKRFFYKPITKVLDDRKKRIEESLKNADLIEEKLAQTEEKTTKLLEEASETAREMITSANKEAQRTTEEVLLEARKTQEELVADAKDQIEAQKKEMQKQLERETLILVTEVVKKVLARNLKQDEKKKLTRDALSEIGKHIH
ncbi:ATP synthase F0 subunit B [Candidatus Curtissbacteria bacterium RIFCSPHIGHO2_01_FULL_41_11]|uniref:ATP synthase subunit b n=1 Tax=Candidatus Curtissbacteria bacterium RIFCSPHIGHO2_01_FULL_41_11 TaxID=1797711 RepID=A0A1F5G6B0_9BACT|nr:MAG: ATP synthase F0 subunit B [Candidatus Curtissbacteria bacterium RIFCSPHIGHO2_01_FULL_41_11]